MKLRIWNDDWPLLRLIAPKYPKVNIFSGSLITPLGLVLVATAALMLGLRVEVIDENNYIGPRDVNGLPDHAAMQRERPVSIVGFYCGLTSVMDRVRELAAFYHAHEAIVIAGGSHVHYCPEEALNGDIDIVVHGNGEIAIREIVTALLKDGDISGIRGISFKQNGKHERNLPEVLELPNLDQRPYPDYGLVRQAGKRRTYAVNYGCGCEQACEFCQVKGRHRHSTPTHLFNTICFLVDTIRARHFFIVDDNLAEDRDGILQFFLMIAKKYGNRLHFTVQIRLATAKDTELVEAMRAAGVRMVCIGYESPIREDLIAMKKGLSIKQMVEWSLILRKYFWVHGMFIFGYPNETPSTLTAAQMIARYKEFILKARVCSIQAMKTVPFAGTELHRRLEKEERLFPRDVIPLRKYDGNYVCYVPDNMTIRELQEAPIEIMRWFYRHGALKVAYRTLAFPIYYFFAGWRRWHESWKRALVKFGGRRILNRFSRDKDEIEEFVANLEKYTKNAPRAF